MATTEEVQGALKVLSDAFGVRFGVVEGGPSAADPIGLTDFYFSIRGKSNAGCIALGNKEVLRVYGAIN